MNLSLHFCEHKFTKLVVIKTLATQIRRKDLSPDVLHRLDRYLKKTVGVSRDLAVSGVAETTITLAGDRYYRIENIGIEDCNIRMAQPTATTAVAATDMVLAHGNSIEVWVGIQNNPATTQDSPSVLRARCFGGGVPVTTLRITEISRG